MKPLFSWLHLSDIHVSPHEASDRYDQRLVMQELLQELKDYKDYHIPRPDSIIITGDVAATGKVKSVSEYEDAKKWLDSVAALFGLSPADIFMVPGNHDIQRTKIPREADTSRLLEDLRSTNGNKFDKSLSLKNDLGQLLGRLKHYSEFSAAFGPPTSSMPGEAAQICWCRMFAAPSGAQVCIMGLNTALLSLTEHEEKKLALGKAQLVALQHAGQLAKSSGALLIVLTHHPFEWLRDGEDVKKWSRRIADLHLCGHIHIPEFTSQWVSGGSDFVEIVAGAVYAGGSQPESHGFSFAAVYPSNETEHTFVRVWPFSWSSTNKDFRIDRDCVPKREFFADHELPRFSRPKTIKLGKLARPYPIGGEKPFEGPLKAIPGATLDEFQGSARRHLDIVGHSLTGLFVKKGGQQGLLNALVNGAIVRVIFLDPMGPHSEQVAQIGRRVGRNLKSKIEESIRQALVLKQNLRLELSRMKPAISDAEVEDALVRFLPAASRLIAYVHIQRADDTLLISQYSQASEPGEEAPTRELLKEREPALFNFYSEEFERIWGAALPIEEVLSQNGIQADRSRLLTHLSSVQSIYRSVIAKSSDSLPYPKMMVVLPSMSCSIRCKSCFTWNAKSMDNRQMSRPLFESLLRQAEQHAIGCLELTGGGEPLDHPEIIDFIHLATQRRPRSFRFGLLTNAIRLGMEKELLDAVLDLDYIRVGYTEHLDSTRGHDEDEFFAILLNLGRRREQLSSNLRIGAKLLLTHTNHANISHTIRKLLDLRIKQGGKHIVNHIKIKSIRGEDRTEPTQDDMRRIEHELAALKSKYGERAKDLQVDVKSAIVNPQTYKCWISPIMTVIDASGDVYLCCNFYEKPDDTKLGSLGSDGEIPLSSVWGSARHRTVLENIPVSTVCNSHLGCNCRLVHYQELVEPYVPYADRATTVESTFFQGHAQML